MTIDPKNFDWTTWEPTERAVLLFLFQGDQVLLIHKKRGLGTGKINGPGGRLEPGETFDEAAVRETREETGIVASDLVEVATLGFVFVDGYSLYAKVFFAYRHEGTLQETDEAAPFWCSVAEIPYHRMWEDDPLWLPRALEGSYVDARFIFDGDAMLTQDIKTKARKA